MQIGNVINTTIWNLTAPPPVDPSPFQILWANPSRIKVILTLNRAGVTTVENLQPRFGQTSQQAQNNGFAIPPFLGYQELEFTGDLWVWPATSTNEILFVTELIYSGGSGGVQGK